MYNLYMLLQTINYMTKSILKSTAIALTLLAVSSTSALAAGSNYGTNQCQPIYGGGESCPKTPQFEINKTVQNPKSQSFVDNLSVSDPRFAPEQVVPFKLTVKNTSDTALSKIVIKDILPDFVDFAGGIGNFDANSRTLTINLEKLDVNESRDFFIQAKVKTADKLSQNVTCVVNQSTMTVNDKTAQDNSAFCIEKTLTTPTTQSNPGNPAITKGGLPVYPPTKATTTPQTGPEALSLFGLIPSAIGGFILRRKSK